MSDTHAVRDASMISRGPEVIPIPQKDDYAERAADRATELYAQAERARRKDSLAELLTRGRES